MRRKIGVVFCILGVLLAVFGIVWITAIWPSLAKIPADLVQQVDLQGTVALYDQEQGTAVSYDVSGHRKYTALKASDDIVYLQEDLWFEDVSTDNELTAIRQQLFLGIDRVTRQNVDGRGDGVGGGQYTFPFNVSKDKVYPFWNEGNPENIDCKYVGEEDYEGLHLYIFEMTTPSEGLTIPGSFDTPTMRVDQTIRLWVEPVTGMPVKLEDHTKRSGQVPVQDELFPATGSLSSKDVTFYEDNLVFTQDTMDDLVSQAKSAKTQVALAKNLLPWLSISSGVLLVAVGLFLARKSSRVAPPPEPQATSGSQPA